MYNLVYCTCTFYMDRFTHAIWCYNNLLASNVIKTTMIKRGVKKQFSLGTSISILSWGYKKLTKNVESCKKGNHESDIHLWIISTTLFTVATKRKFLISSLVYLSHYLQIFESLMLVGGLTFNLQFWWERVANGAIIKKKTWEHKFIFHIVFNFLM